MAALPATLAALAPSATDLAWSLSIAGKAALLLAASWLGAALLRRGSAAARHQLWALGVAGALLLPLFASTLPALPLPAWTSPALPGSLDLSTTGGGSLAATPIVATVGVTTRGAAPTWPAWLALVWGAGVVLVSLRLARGHLAARRLRRTADLTLPESWSTAWREARASLALAGAVGLGRSEAIRSPMTVGVLSPLVLLPAAADDWSPARLRAVLVHELGHVGRKDTLVQLGAQLACALYWWNPLAWLAASRLRIEREHACDDLVLGAGIQPSSYATDLLDVARRTGATPAGAIGMVDRSSTETRLRRILDPSTSRRPLGPHVRLATGAVALLTCVTLACTSSPEASPAPVVARAATAAPSLAPSLDQRARCPVSRRAWSMDDPNPGFYNPPALDVKGPLEPSLVEREVTRHLPDLEQCYQRQRLADPELAGQILIHWTISTAGEVVEQCITEDTVGDNELRACVNALVKATRYPAPITGSVNVSYPFVFSPVPGC